MKSKRKRVHNICALNFLLTWNRFRLSAIQMYMDDDPSTVEEQNDEETYV